jgi:ABC-2 type transport system ATP-binding protein
VPDGIVPYPEHALLEVFTFFGNTYNCTLQKMDEIIESLHLQPMMECRVAQLFKGWRRRLLLAIGLLAPHPLLVMDEPFDGFDLRQTGEARLKNYFMLTTN